MSVPVLVWRERTPELESVASVWAIRAAVMMQRVVPADPCISIILVQSDASAEVIIRGPETAPRREILLPGYTWIGIRLRPGVQLKNFPAQQLTDSFRILPADSNGQFQFDGTLLQFPSFSNAEQLIKRMQDLGCISGKALNSQESPQKVMSSKSYSRFVKRSTGLSPYKLHQLQRISEALRLLRQGMAAVTVASELGFADQAHLTRAAKQFLGYTPKELLRWPHNF
ncbi:MAG TPA: helix-turn-helix domain-containing protein [Bacillota bacterium]|nr:helix-turn-helix domain-containing protein [Bacillota bacterium]